MVGIQKGPGKKIFTFIKVQKYKSMVSIIGLYVQSRGTDECIM